MHMRSSDGLVKLTRRTVGLRRRDGRGGENELPVDAALFQKIHEALAGQRRAPVVILPEQRWGQTGGLRGVLDLKEQSLARQADPHKSSKQPCRRGL